VREKVESKTAWYVINYHQKEFADRRMTMLAPYSEIVRIEPLTAEGSLARFFDEFEEHVVFNHYGNVISSQDITQSFLDNAQWLVDAGSKS